MSRSSVVTTTVLSVLLIAATSSVTSDRVIKSEELTKWGTWGDWDRCPNDTAQTKYARGFKLLTEAYHGALIDDTCLNGIMLFCGNPLDGSGAVMSSVGPFGRWGNTYSCGDGYLQGFAMRVEKPPNLDETAANNMRFYCSNADGRYIEGDGNAFGTWGVVMRCANNEAICSLQTQVQPSQGPFDEDTALNNVNFECCDLP